MPIPSRFGLAHLTAWVAQGDAARLERLASEAEPFSMVTMSSLPDGSPPMRPGGLFVAIRGERRDGHDFVRDAFENGARAALVSHVPEGLPEALRPRLVLVDDPQASLQGCAAWWRRQMPARVIGITGSVGKTTTKDLIASVLSRRYVTLATEGNLNNELGLPFMLLKLTPAHQRAVLEIGISDVGEMATFARIATPDVAVVTRVAPAHLHHFRDVDTVEREKGMLVEALTPAGVAILNADDPRVARMATRAPGRVVRYGEAAGADVRAISVVDRGFAGLEMAVLYQGRTERIAVPLVGRHFVTSALAAAATGFVEGCSWDDVLAGLATEPETPRMKPRRLPSGVTLLDDTYNASPAAMRAALDVLAGAQGRRIAVLGDMFELGEYAERGHFDVGNYVPGRADHLVTVGELGALIARAAREAGMPPSSVEHAADNASAAAVIAARLRPGDFVLVKGSRGMRMDEIVRALAGDDPAGGSHH